MPPYSSTARRDHLLDRLLVGDVHGATASARRRPYARHDLVGDLLRALGVQVADDDVGAARGEQPAAARPIPLAPPVTTATRPAELAARRGLRELVALERPVLDRERLALAQRAEAAERVGRVLDRDRAVVEVAAKRARPASPPRGDDPDAGHEHDARAGRIDRELPCLVVEVPLVVRRDTSAQYVLDAVAEARRAARPRPAFRVEVDDERLVLGADQVVRAGRADLAHLGRPHRRGERDRLGASVDLEDDAVCVGEQGAAERGKGSRRRAAAVSFPQLRDLSAAEAEAALGGSFDGLGGTGDELERRVVALLAVAPQVTSPCRSSSTARAPGVLLEQLGDPPGHVEPRPLVVEPDRLVAERLLGERRPSGVDVSAMTASGWVWSTWSARDERVQQRLDRGPRLIGPERAAEQVVDHRRVVHRVALAERQELVEAEPGEAGGGDRREVRARALHPEDACLAAGVVDDRLLGGGVAPALVRERAIGAEQVRAVDERRRAMPSPSGGVRPSGLRGRDALEDAGRCSRAHRERLRRRARRTARAPRPTPPSRRGS